MRQRLLAVIQDQEGLLQQSAGQVAFCHSYGLALPGVLAEVLVLVVV